MKWLVYVDSPGVIDFWEENIRHVIANIWQQLLEKM